MKDVVVVQRKPMLEELGLVKHCTSREPNQIRI